MDYLIGAIIGSVLGGFACFFLLKKMAAESDGKVESLLNSQIEKLKSDNSDLNSKLEDQNTNS